MQRKLMWVLFLTTSILGSIFAFTFFQVAHPFVTMDISMNRQMAIEKAREMADSKDWGPVECKTAVSFDVDDSGRNYVELEAGGRSAFKDLVESEFYSPYVWEVRFFDGDKLQDVSVKFRPDGRFYGFVENIPEDYSDDNFDLSDARVFAERTAALEHNIDLSHYTFDNQKLSKNRDGRPEYLFTYMNDNNSPGESRFALRLKVSGRKLSEVGRYLEVPDGFLQRYDELKNSNATIAWIGLAGVFVFYILGGSVIALIIMARNGDVVWRTPLLWCLILSAMMILAVFNGWETLWMDYSVEISEADFLGQKLSQLMTRTLIVTTILCAVAVSATSMGVKAFPKHVQFWRVWTKEAGSSYEVIGQTALGYFLTGVYFAIYLGLSILAEDVFGWWIPSEFEATYLASTHPWYDAISAAASSGVFEELAFRAIPIAGAALIGERLGKRNAWIWTALILQTVIFCLVHANHPQQPGYARLVVELIVPTFLLGLAYIKFGLLPGVVLHYTANTIWEGLPIFVSSAPGMVTQKLIWLGFHLLPFIMILIARMRFGRFHRLRAEFLNESCLR